jgi:beta-glucosidase-like glycosyl hydrolase
MASRFGGVLTDVAVWCGQVCRDPRWGRCYESYSEDRRLVQNMTELIPGLQGDVPQNFTSGMPFAAGK